MSEEQIESRSSDDGVEYDENGIPYYKWPPFPRIPEGVNIIPFKDFKPSGIQIQLGDDIEVDGLGIETVRLNVTHDNDAPPKKKKKTKRNNAGEEIRRAYIWWQDVGDWAEGEPQRIRSAKLYNQMDDPETRLFRVAEEFKNVHDWGPIGLRLAEWWQKFLYNLGLNDASIRPRFVRSKTEDLQHEEDSDDDVDMNTSDPSRQPEKPAPVTIEKFDEEKHKLQNRESSFEPDERFLQRVQKIKDKQQLRRLRFIDDPEREVKIFLSSAFMDSGLLWENMALRDAPRIVEFFLDYALQTRAFPENDTSLKLALKVARKAIVELPLTKKIGVSIPDHLARCLISTFGSQLKESSWTIEPEAEAQFEAQVVENGGEIISGSLESPANIDDDTTVGPPPAEETNGWAVGNIDAAGASAWGALPSDGDSKMDENPWAQPSPDAWALPDIYSLMALVGPTSLPLTHTVGYVEFSTRYISTVMLPEVKPTRKDATYTKETCTSSDLFNSYARVVLKAYPTFADPSAPRAAIQPPELLKDPWAGISSSDLDSEDASADAVRPRIPRHDPRKDSITLLIDPEAAKDLALGRNMGLGGTFVQIIPDHTFEPASRGGTGRGRGSRGRGRGGGQEGKGLAAKDVSFWYAEKLLQVIPSFWTENLR